MPLRIYLGLASEREPVQPLVVSKIGKHRLYGGHALAVKPPALGAVDGPLHAFGEMVRQGLVPGKKRYLLLWVRVD